MRRATAAAQVRLGLHRHDLGHVVAVVLEVEAVARADLQDPPAQAVDQVGAVAPPHRVATQDRGPGAREQRVLAGRAHRVV
jgi:hypothetical protein